MKKHLIATSVAGVMMSAVSAYAALPAACGPGCHSAPSTTAYPNICTATDAKLTAMAGYAGASAASILAERTAMCSGGGTPTPTPSTTPPPSTLPAACGPGCHAMPSTSAYPNICTATDAKLTTMAGMAGASAATILAARTAMCGGGTPTPTPTPTPSATPTPTPTPTPSTTPPPSTLPAACGPGCHAMPSTSAYPNICNATDAKLTTMAGYASASAATIIAARNSMCGSGTPTPTPSTTPPPATLPAACGPGCHAMPSTSAYPNICTATDAKLTSMAGFAGASAATILAARTAMCGGGGTPTPTPSSSPTATPKPTTPPSTGGVMYSIYGWRNAYEQHRDYSERYGVVNAGPSGPACIGCHSMGRTTSAMGAPGCQACHGAKFCGTPGSSVLPECSSRYGSSGSYGTPRPSYTPKPSYSPTPRPSYSPMPRHRSGDGWSRDDD